MSALASRATGLLFPAFPVPLPHVSGRSGRSGNKRSRNSLENIDRKDAGRFAQGCRWATGRLHRPYASKRHPSVLFLGVLAAFWSGWAAADALIKGTNRAYDLRETRPLWKLASLSVAMVWGL